MSRLKLVLVLTVAAYLTSPCSGGHQQHLLELPRKPLSTDRRSTHAPAIDPCNKERNMRMICHCEHQQYHQPSSYSPPQTQEDKSETSAVNAAECWILKHDFSDRDPLWKAFDQYTSIRELKFIVQSGSLNFIPTAALKKLHHLANLSITFSHIKSVKSYAFANHSHLQIVRLNHNNLSEILPFAFANHQRLETLDLQENEISLIDGDAFVNLPSLERLLLGSNKLVRIPKGVLRNLNNLLELQLQNNLIAEITANEFLRLENLRVLQLSSNQIKSIGNAAFTELWSLQDLYLENNNIEIISERAFDGLNNLRRLSLQRNHLKTLERNVFTSLPGLAWLNLAENRLTTLSVSSVLENFMKTDSSLILHGNQFICDCKLNWLLELRNKTNSNYTKQSIERVKCLLTSTDNVPDDILLNALEQPTNARDYIADETFVTDSSTQIQSVDLEEGFMVNLLLLEKLPCLEDENDPTSMPMPRESTGARDSGGVGRSLQSSLLATVVVFSAFVICIIT